MPLLQQGSGQRATEEAWETNAKELAAAVASAAAQIKPELVVVAESAIAVLLEFPPVSNWLIEPAFESMNPLKPITPFFLPA